jgi:cytochrome c oxidase subunit 2
VFGAPVRLTTGETVKADEAYLRESILNPSAKIVAGYQNIMPSFQGQVTEEDLLQLMEYIKSLGKPAAAEGSAAPRAPIVRRAAPARQNR